MMVASIDLPGNCRTVSRHAPKNVTWGDPDELRGCLPIVRKVLNKCSGSRVSTRNRQNSADISPCYCQIGPCFARTGQDMLQYVPNSGRNSAPGTPVEQLSGNLQTTSELIGIAPGNFPARMANNGSTTVRCVETRCHHRGLSPRPAAECARHMLRFRCSSGPCLGSALDKPSCADRAWSYSERRPSVARASGAPKTARSCQLPRARASLSLGTTGSHMRNTSRPHAQLAFAHCHTPTARSPDALARHWRAAGRRRRNQ